MRFNVLLVLFIHSSIAFDNSLRRSQNHKIDEELDSQGKGLRDKERGDSSNFNGGSSDEPGRDEVAESKDEFSSQQLDGDETKNTATLASDFTTELNEAEIDNEVKENLAKVLSPKKRRKAKADAKENDSVSASAVKSPPRNRKFQEQFVRETEEIPTVSKSPKAGKVKKKAEEDERSYIADYEDDVNSYGNGDGAAVDGRKETTEDKNEKKNQNGNNNDKKKKNGVKQDKANGADYLVEDYNEISSSGSSGDSSGSGDFGGLGGSGEEGPDGSGSGSSGFESFAGFGSAFGESEEFDNNDDESGSGSGESDSRSESGGKLTQGDERGSGSGSEEDSSQVTESGSGKHEQKPKLAKFLKLFDKFTRDFDKVLGSTRHEVTCLMEELERKSYPIPDDKPMDNMRRTAAKNLPENNLLCDCLLRKAPEKANDSEEDFDGASKLRLALDDAQEIDDEQEAEEAFATILRKMRNNIKDLRRKRAAKNENEALDDNAYYSDLLIKLLENGNSNSSDIFTTTLIEYVNGNRLEGKTFLRPKVRVPRSVRAMKPDDFEEAKELCEKHKEDTNKTLGNKKALNIILDGLNKRIKPKKSKSLKDLESKIENDLKDLDKEKKNTDLEREFKVMKKAEKALENLKRAEKRDEKQMEALKTRISGLKNKRSKMELCLSDYKKTNRKGAIRKMRKLLDEIEAQDKEMEKMLEKKKSVEKKLKSEESEERILREIIDKEDTLITDRDEMKGENLSDDKQNEKTWSSDDQEMWRKKRQAESDDSDDEKARKEKQYDTLYEIWRSKEIKGKPLSRQAANRIKGVNENLFKSVILHKLAVSTTTAPKTELEISTGEVQRQKHRRITDGVDFAHYASESPDKENNGEAESVLRYSRPDLSLEDIFSRYLNDFIEKYDSELRGSSQRVTENDEYDEFYKDEGEGELRDLSTAVNSKTSDKESRGNFSLRLPIFPIFSNLKTVHKILQPNNNNNDKSPVFPR